MTYFRKFDFSEEKSKDPQKTFENNMQNFLKSSMQMKLNGSKYKPLRYSEHIDKIQKFIKKNISHGFNFLHMRLPREEDVFSNQLKILYFKMVTFLKIEENFKLKPKYNLGETLLGTLRGGFKFNSEYHKRLQADTREFLKGETDIVYQDFPASHLLPWIDEDPIENIYVFDEPLPINQNTFDRTMSACTRNIVDNALIRNIDLIDALYLVDQKKTNQLDSKGRTKTNFEARGTEMDISFPTLPILDYLFKKVTTDPCTSRCAGILDVKGRNLVYTAHSNLDKVTFSDHDLYKEGINHLEWKGKLSEQAEGYFLMVDFKKSGLTTNRNVIKAVYRTALEHYPKYRPWEYYLECLENVMVNGAYSKRGTSLGMDDNAISFFLSCAFEAWQEIRPEFKADIEFAYFKGDDQIIRTKCNMEKTKRIFRSWIKCLQHLGFLINAKKSFIGKRGQFCEVVGSGHNIDNKSIEFSLNAFDALGTYNMVDFKISLNSLNNARGNVSVRSQIFDFCMATVIRSVEPELNDDEIYVPFEMGGYFSSYENRLNLFIYKCLQNDYHEYRRLYRLIGWECPKVAESWRRKKRLITTEFKDVNMLFNKLRKYSAKPMSNAWKKQYDECLEQRRKLYYDEKPFILGGKLQKLIDLKINYALPVEFLTPVEQEKVITYLPKKRVRRKIAEQLKEQNRSKRLIKTFENRYYFIDEIRAKLILKSAKDGEYFGIDYYTKLPISSIIWSLAKNFAKSKYAIPLAWCNYIFENHIDVDSLWKFYGDRGVNIYHYNIRLETQESISSLFKGPNRSDLLIFCPFTGFPIKFLSTDFQIKVLENKVQTARQFYTDLTTSYFYDWYSPELMSAWWGHQLRNEPFYPRINYEEVTYVDPELRRRMELYPGIEYCPEGVDPEVFFWYYEHYIEIIFDEENVHEEESLDFGFNLITDPNQETDEDEDYEQGHDSSSDLEKEYFRNNPLDSQSEGEENPYLHDSTDSEVSDEG